MNEDLMYAMHVAEECKKRAERAEARVRELESFVDGLANWCHGHFTDLITVGLGEIERVLRVEER
jgi:hypothetical protein